MKKKSQQFEYNHDRKKLPSSIAFSIINSSAAVPIPMVIDSLSLPTLNLGSDRRNSIISRSQMACCNDGLPGNSLNICFRCQQNTLIISFSDKIEVVFDTYYSYYGQLKKLHVKTEIALHVHFIIINTVKLLPLISRSFAYQWGHFSYARDGYKH